MSTVYDPLDEEVGQNDDFSGQREVPCLDKDVPFMPQYQWGKVLRMSGVLLGVAGALALLFATVIVMTSKPTTEPSRFSPQAKTTSFCTDPVGIAMNARVEWFRGPFSRDHMGIPSDVPVLIKQVGLSLRDRRQRVVPLEHVYNHHVFLFAATAEGTDWHGIAGFGAEGPLSDPITYGSSEGILVKATDQVFADGEWLDVWGTMATFNQSVSACFDLVYEVTDDPEVVRWTDNPVQMGLIGTAADSDFEFEIPPSHEDGCSCPSSEVRWDYDSIEIFFAFGHVHIGAVNQTLSRVEPTGKQVDLAFSKTEYAPSGFLNRISNHILVPHLILQRGSVYRTTACYTNRDEGYAGVMALWGVWFRNLDNPSVHLNFEDDK